MALLNWGRRTAGTRVLVRQVKDPTVLGVHRAVGGVLPPYVRRDQHEAVVDLLTPGRFVLLVGDACAGRSRLGWAAVSARLPGYRLFAPDPAGLPAALAALATVRQGVLWLADLDRFLGTAILRAGMLDAVLAEGRRLVVATLRTVELDQLTAEPDRTVTDSRRVLALADQVRVASRFTPAELARAGGPVDDRVGARLAGGLRLLDRWRAGERTQPRGAALVAAAIDCRRAGLLVPPPAALLDALAGHYLPAAVDPEPAERAWAWARAPWRQGGALLSGPPDAVRVFDYVLDHVQRDRPFDHVPEPVVLAVAEHADRVSLASMGQTAARAGRYALALDLHRRALAGECGVSQEVLDRRAAVGVLLAHLGRLDEALAEHRLVLAARRQVLGPDHPDTLTSRTNLATVLNLLGRHESALAEHRTVLSVRGRLFGPDHPDTLTSRDNVATVLNDLGRQDEALAEHRAEHEAAARVLGADHPDTLVSRHNLGRVLTGMGRYREAAAELEQALRARRRVLGPTHPDTLATREVLVTVLLEVTRYG